MKQLMVDIVNRTYRLLHTLCDEHLGDELVSHLADQDPKPGWNVPTLGGATDKT
jgi:hypothetical protein